MIALTRRKFLGTALKGLALAGTIPLLRHEFSYTQAVEAASGQSKYLIILNLSGGGDSHYLFPYIGQHAATLVEFRGGIQDGIAVDPATAIPINSELGLNPLLSPLASLHTAGQLKLIQKVGMPDPSGSHNDASNYYSLGARYGGGSARAGWVGRLMNSYQFESFDVYGLSSGNRLDFAGAENTPILADRLGWYNYSNRVYDLGGDWESIHSREVLKSLANLRVPHTETESRLKNAQTLYQDSVVRVQRIAQMPTGQYPATNQGANFADVERVIRDDRAAANQHNKIFYVSMGGYDTHSDTRPHLDGALPVLANAISAFATNIAALDPQIWANTMILVYGEFGRTLRMGGGAGTNHGNAQTMLAVGGSIRGGQLAVAGPLPTAAELNERNDLEYAVDFRNVLGSAVSWMGYDQARIFTETYNHYDVQLTV